MAQESPKEKAGGMAYEVILAPASSDAAPLRPGSPPKERPLSTEDIEKKLKEAEERRQAEVAAKLASIAKDKERAQEALKRMEELNDSFSKTAEKRLSARFEAADERKDAQIKELQDRLKEHEKHVQDVLEASGKLATLDIEKKQKSINKMETTLKNREDQLAKIKERLQEHEKHSEKVRANKMNQSLSEESINSS